MKKVSDALHEVLQSNPVLSFCFQREILNLTRLSRLLIPVIEARTGKEVSEAAITMSLSRMQKTKMDIDGGKIPTFEISSLTLQSGLIIVTYEKQKLLGSRLEKVHRVLQKENGYLTQSEGIHEVTLIFESKYKTSVIEIMGQQPFFLRDDTASVSIRFSEKYIDQDGFLFFVLQALAVQKINILEVTSTTREFVLYVSEIDARLALDTLYLSFSKFSNERPEYKIFG